MNKALLCVAAVLLAGCGSNSSESAFGPAAVGQLQGDYRLVEVDGVAAQSSMGQPPMLGLEQELGVAGLRIHTDLCNRIMGNLSLNNGVLSGNLASTRMMCSDQQLNSWEAAFNQMFSTGAQAQRKGTVLILQGNGHTFVYEVVPKP